MRFLDRLVALVLDGAKWLALPVVCLLFLQWPLRAVFGLYSREANDRPAVTRTMRMDASRMRPILRPRINVETRSTML